MPTTDSLLIPSPYLNCPLGLPRPFHCLSLTSRRLSAAFPRLSTVFTVVTSHRISLTSHCLPQIFPIGMYETVHRALNVAREDRSHGERETLQHARQSAAIIPMGVMPMGFPIWGDHHLNTTAEMAAGDGSVCGGSRGWRGVD